MIAQNSTQASPGVARMQQVTIYHNPRCSKSRATLQLLQDRGLQPQVIEYLETPPTAAQIETLLQRLGLQARQLMRSNEAEYRELGLDKPDLTREQLIQAMAEHPRLIHRPIVLSGERAALGRPPESVLEIV
jgi:arsenate reductase